jgi:hypothetical protein
VSKQVRSDNKMCPLTTAVHFAEVAQVRSAVMTPKLFVLEDNHRGTAGHAFCPIAGRETDVPVDSILD